MQFPPDELIAAFREQVNSAPDTGVLALFEATNADTGEKAAALIYVEAGPYTAEYIKAIEDCHRRLEKTVGKTSKPLRIDPSVN